jgi:hypothetical protein
VPLRYDFDTLLNLDQMYDICLDWDDVEYDPLTIETRLSPSDVVITKVE